MKISKLKREMIMHYFYTTHDNRDCVIAEKFGLPRSSVCSLISSELNKKMKRINERVNQLKDK